LEAVGGEPGEGKQAKTAMACGRRREKGRRRVWGGGGEASGVGSSRPDGLKKKRRGNTVRIRKNAP